MLKYALHGISYFTSLFSVGINIVRDVEVSLFVSRSVLKFYISNRHHQFNVIRSVSTLFSLQFTMSLPWYELSVIILSLDSTVYM